MKYFYLIASILFLSGCKNQGDNGNSDMAPINEGSTLLNLGLLYSEYEQNISFPVVFNDSVIRSKNILSIERIFYFSDSDTTRIDELEESSDKSILYQFDQEGMISSIEVKNYYDNRPISKILIDYKGHQLYTGFAVASILDESEIEDFPYKMYRSLSQNSNLFTFESKLTGDKLYVIPNRKNWKPLVVDTLCRPRKEDVIVWGSLKKPHKIYQVNNLVEESNVREFNYVKNTLTSITWTDDPFKIVRTLRYDDRGYCNGLIDSTFSLGSFVSTSHYEFILKKDLPQEIRKKRFTSTGSRVVFRELFKYTFR